MRARLVSRFTLPLLIVLLALSVVASGCGDGGGGARKPNLPPSIAITGGPPEDPEGGYLEDSYTARIWWTGWDEDGFIRHYEYTVDPPAAFSSDEVAAPEKYLTSAGGTLSLLVVRGAEASTDTLQFTKVVDGRTYRMDWIQTPDFSQSFALKTPVADSTQSGSTKIARERYSGIHVIFVRCQDNEDAYSGVDYLGYNAVTQTPKSHIVKPRSTAEILSVGTQITISWDGTDADAPDPQKKPVGYLYKLISVQTLSPPLPLLTLRDPEFVAYVSARSIPWVYQRADTLQKGFFLEVGKGYLFVVRAVDVAGAIEPAIAFATGADTPGNAIKFQSLTTGGQPTLTLREPSLGTVTFPTVKVPEFEVPAGTSLSFTWQGTADDYGGTIEAYNYGTDIVDLDREGPGSGWFGWSTITRVFEPVVFRKPGVHFFYVRVRDTGGAETLGTILLRVVEFPLNEEIFVIDDYRDTTYPRDAEHDQFWVDILKNSNRFDPEYLAQSERWRFDSHGLSDVYYREPQVPELSTFGRYKLVIFDCDGAGYDGLSGLVKSGPVTRHLGAYLSAGGKIWLSGKATVAAMTPNVTGKADFTYPKEITANTFPWDFFKMYSGDVRNDKSARNDRNGMIAVEPLANWPQILPKMEVDQNKMNPALRGKYGIGNVDAIFEGIFEGSNPDFSGKIDSLYVMRAFAPYFGTASSVYDRKLAGYRWHDPDPDRAQGRVMWFGFPVYWFPNDVFQETFNRTIDWFREEQVGQTSP